MSNAVNYSDVVAQLEGHGLVLDGGLQCNTPSPVRCMLDGEPKRKGWYALYEVPFDNGDVYIVGSYGIWSGSESGSQKVELPKDTKRSKEDNALVRKRMAENRKRALAEEKRKQGKAAANAHKQWRAYDAEGESGYLNAKQVQPYGVRFTKDGAVVVPMFDVDGKVHGLQFIMDGKNEAHKPKIKKNHGSNKKFWPFGLKMRGHFHLIGAVGKVLVITEGYATGASIHEATGLPVAVVFTANNILPCMEALRKRYPSTNFLIAADDDYLCRCGECKKQTLVAEKICSHCDKPHGKHNTGVSVAMKACALIPNSQWIIPEFTAREGRKLTDFNDLHVDESLQAVAAQVNDAVADKFPSLGSSEAASGNPVHAGEHHGGAGKALAPFITVDDACDRYSVVYGVKDLLFDHQEGELVPKSCVMDLLPDHGWREWKTRVERKVVRFSEVGFDPTGLDRNIKCNLWTGWPTTPDNTGSCEKLLSLLEYMCSGEKNPREVFMWTLRWLAYPIQNHGAKMRTALVFHGPQGAGKNIFFEAIKDIYGKYGFIVGQDALEDTFTDWLSAKLYLIANEVVARQELFHTKNRIKGLITEDTIRIRAPYVKSMWEKNHANLVFLSNETQPLVLEKDDRRFMVVWTPKPKPNSFYKEAAQEARNGGIEALHHYLLHLDLGDFNEHTKPLHTNSKDKLIELSKETPDRFIDDWLRGELDAPPKTCALADLYTLYERWCRAEGERFTYAKNKFSARLSRCAEIDVIRKAMRVGYNKTKVVTVAVLADDNPDGQSWLEWLPAKIKDFRAAVDGNHDF